MRILRVLIWTAALCALTAPAVAASRGDWDACKGDDPDQSIAACTRIIQGRGETAKNSAIARRYRGLAYQRKDDLDRAIADYSEAIRLDPKYAEAYYGRGLTYRNKGDVERAIADYSEAIRLDPKLAAAYNNRGNAYREMGDLDLAYSPGLQPGDPTCSPGRSRLSGHHYSPPCALQPRRRVRGEGRHRPRHRRFWRGDPARSRQLRRCLL